MSAINFSTPNLLGGSDMISNALNSQLASTMYQALANQQRESRGMPDSTRRAFLSGMESDARIARQGAQNMGDAAGMLTVAQTGVTTVKYTLTEMRTLANEMASNKNLSEEEYKGYSDRLNDYVDYMVGVAQTTEFNGFQLLNGSKSVFQLQAGNMQVDADMTNMLDAGLTGDNVTNGNSANLANLKSYFDPADLATDDGVDKLTKALDKLIDFSANAEASLSNDIKGVTNLGTLLESQADIHDAVRENHMISGDNDTGSDGTDTPDSAAYLDALLQGTTGTGNILSGTS